MDVVEHQLWFVAIFEVRPMRRTLCYLSDGNESNRLISIWKVPKSSQKFFFLAQNVRVWFNNLWFIFHNSSWSFPGSYFSRKNIFHESYIEWTEHKVMVLKPANKYQIIRYWHYFENILIDDCQHYSISLLSKSFSNIIFANCKNQTCTTWFTQNYLITAPEKCFIKLCSTCFLRKFQYLIHVWLIIFSVSYQTFRFETQNIKFRLRSRIILFAFWKYFFTWNTQNITWEKCKFLEYLLNIFPSFHAHFVLNQDHELIFFSSWKKYMFFFYLSLFHFLFL